MPRQNASALRQALLEKHNHTCQSCGVTEEPLQLAHITPLSRGGTEEINNLAILCPSCHSLLDTFRPREAEFSFFLKRVLDASPNYSNVVAEQRLGKRYRADLTATRKSHDRSESLLIELKGWSFFREKQVDSAIIQIDQYRTVAPFDTAAIVFPGRISKDDQDTLEAANIEVWDLDYVASTFATEIAELPFSGFKQLYTMIPESDSDKVWEILLNRVHDCTPGKDDWVEFQRVIKDIFEYLFTPPLGPPLWEHSDLLKINRRDIIFPNYAYEGFWKFLRESYYADYIVVDAKNFKRKIKKTHVLQMGNYLKPYGAGMFGIIVCRQGGDAGCLATIREQWSASRKLIVLLTDRDVRNMLTAAGSGGKPEDVVGQAIQDFRLSM